MLCPKQYVSLTLGRGVRNKFHCLRPLPGEDRDGEPVHAVQLPRLLHRPDRRIPARLHLRGRGRAPLQRPERAGGQVQGQDPQSTTKHR